MEKTYSIRPIALCLSGSDLGRYTYRMGYGIGCAVVTTVWYIEGASRHILVDAGITAEQFKDYGWRVPKYDLQSLEQGLGKLSLKPEDIDLVIVTHMHFDHVALGYKYTKAKFLVQKDELWAAENEIPPWDPYNYIPGAWKGLDFEVMEGDYEVEEGINCWLTPGHTRGGQSVVIDTPKGKAIIDCFCSQWENYYPYPAMYRPTMKREEDMPPDPPVALTGPRWDNENSYKSLLKIKEAADILIPGHSPKYLNVDRIP